MSKKQNTPVRYLPDDKVMEFAQDILANKYFFSTQIHEGQLKHLLHIIFLPLAFLSKKAIEKMDKDGVGVFYAEYSKQVGSRSINGYPMFSEAAMLTRADLEKVREAVALLHNAMEKAKNEHEAATRDNELKHRNPKKGPRRGPSGKRGKARSKNR